MDALEKASTWVAVFLTFVFAVAIIVACVALIWAMKDVRRIVQKDVVLATNSPMESYADGRKRHGGGKRRGKHGDDNDDDGAGGSGGGGDDDDAEEGYTDAAVRQGGGGGVVVNKSWW